MVPKILVADDEAIVLKTFKVAFEDKSFEVEYAQSVNSALEIVKQSPFEFAAAFVDYNFLLPDGQCGGTGDELTRKLKALNPNIVVILVTGNKSAEAFKKSLKAGVENVIRKPLELDHIIVHAEHALDRFNRLFKNETIHVQPKDSGCIEKFGLVGNSQALSLVTREIEKYAQFSHPVLILGETGTGKELVATALHNASNRSQKPFRVINCSTYSKSTELLESELFGHVKGAFTGAMNEKEGIFESAKGGTVFLDEIHHLAPNAQAKLLRAIQEKKIRKVGSNIEREVDFRLVCSAKLNLRELSEKGEFLPDLFFRISVLDIMIPSLCQRSEDIIPLAHHFKNLIEKELNIFKHFSNTTLEILSKYSWPGNVRELKQVIEKLVIKTDSNVIRPEHLPDLIREKSSFKQEENNQIETYDELIRIQRTQQINLILKALEKSGNNVKEAATFLGMARTSLNSKMKNLGIQQLSNEKRQILLSNTL